MNRPRAHRHLFFFSASLFIHALLVFGLLSVLVVVSDTPKSRPGRALLLSLGENDTGDDVSAVKPVAERHAVPTEERPSIKETVSAPAGDDGTRDDKIGPSIGAIPAASGPTGGKDDASALADYTRVVRAGIERHKRYPPNAARTGIEGTVTVSFVLDDRGNLLDRRVASGSGHPELDEAALAAVDNSSPFPPFPEGIYRETLLFRLPIKYESR